MANNDRILYDCYRLYKTKTSIFMEWLFNTCKSKKISTPLIDQSIPKNMIEKSKKCGYSVSDINCLVEELCAHFVDSDVEKWMEATTTLKQTIKLRESGKSITPH